MFGEEIRRLRAAAGLSIRKLAEAVGVTAAFITHVERYQKIPSAERIAEMAIHLNVSPETLLQTAKEDHQQRVGQGSENARKKLERARQERSFITSGRKSLTVARRVARVNLASAVGPDAALLLCLIAAEPQPVRFDDEALAAAIGADLDRLLAIRSALAASDWLIIARRSPAAAEYTTTVDPD